MRNKTQVIVEHGKERYEVKFIEKVFLEDREE